MKKTGLIKILVLIVIAGLTLQQMTGCRSRAHVRNFDPGHYVPVDFEKWSSGIYNDEFIGMPVVVEGYISKALLGSPIGGFHLFKKPRIRFSVSQYSTEDIRKTRMRGDPNAHIESTEMAFRNISISAPKFMKDQVYALKNKQKIKVYGVVKQTSLGWGIGARIYRRKMADVIPIFVEADRIEVAKLE
ncbi:MAG: hypothetical protein JAY74_08750 [Candidatus Thiodiazotropha taylori]|nr:hypothetical protein [Candidatus Thiodiazotropha taylori]